MSAAPTRTPSYRLHKPTGQAVVTLGSRDIYLGKHGSPESHQRYDQLIVEWISKGRPRRVVDQSGSVPVDLTITEIMVVYLKFADGYYRKGDSPSPEVDNIRHALRPLRRLYGHTPAKEFGPLALKAVREEMIANELCRNQINQRLGRIVRLFKWAVSEELVPASVHQALRTVSGLKRGRSEARESVPVQPVSDQQVEAVRPYVSRQVAAMVELLRLTGMRPGEVCLMRGSDIERSHQVWIYKPHDHKTAYRGKSRTIALGPKAQQVLQAWFQSDPTAYLFSPAEAVAERRAQQRLARATKVQPSQSSRSKTNPQRKPGNRYTTRSLHHAIRYGCTRATIEPWHPHQLRHAAATRLRKEFGLDTARAVLGHSSAVVTEIYAELDFTKAEEAMSRVG